MVLPKAIKLCVPGESGGPSMEVLFYCDAISAEQRMKDEVL